MQSFLEEREGLLLFVFENVPVGIVLSTKEGILRRVNTPFCELLGYRREELQGLHYADITFPGDDDAYSEARRQLFVGDIDRLRYEKRYIKKNGEAVWIRMTMTAPQKMKTNEFASITIVENIENERRAQAGRDLLAGEINHRVKNTLAVVQGLVKETIATAKNRDHLREMIEGRLQSLSSAHDMLTARNWDSISLPELLRLALHETFAPYRDRMVIDCEEVALSPSAAIFLSLAMHELATNAIKHGSLCRPGGSVVVAGASQLTREGRKIRLRWIEKETTLQALPRSKGYGWLLLERGPAMSLDGGESSWSIAQGDFVYDVSFLA